MTVTVTVTLPYIQALQRAAEPEPELDVRAMPGRRRVPAPASQPENNSPVSVPAGSDPAGQISCQ